MDLSHDISGYIASVRISSKKRILVEGRDDKSHILNLLDVLLIGHKIKVDTAESIKGDCDKTSKNNKAKIEKIHNLTKISDYHNHLFYLCDREFVKFDVSNKITDLMPVHESDGNLSWTIGHSLENYFINEDFICKAYRYLCGSEHKTKAEELYRKVFPSSLKVIAAITLSASKIDKCKYPLGSIFWQDFVISNDEISVDIDRWKLKLKNTDPYGPKFYQEFRDYLPVVKNSDVLNCSRICRGHTAMLMLQRTFSACLYEVAKSEDEDIAKKIASDFSHVSEFALAIALSESWIQGVRDGAAIYPVNLVNLVT